MLRSVRVQAEPFDVGREWLDLSRGLAGRAGAVAAFCGRVRDRFEGAGVDHLILEHYPGMTEKSIETIVDEAEARWALEGVVVIHRVGELAPGDEIVLVLAASGHRADAFAACEFVMDYLKTRAVFWKKECSDAGERWVSTLATDYARAAEWEKG
jgi:molybdopterin synthase catalytic subunit